MKKLLIAVAGIFASVVLSAGVLINHADASSLEEIRIERVASYNGELTSKVRFEKNYAVICEPVANGSIEVGVSDIVYSKSGTKATVYLYNKNADEECDAQSNYVAYWNIYLPVNETLQDIEIQWN